MWYMMCPLLRPLVALLTLVQPLRSRAVTWNVEDLLYTEEELLGTLFYSRGVPFNVRLG